MRIFLLTMLAAAALALDSCTPTAPDANPEKSGAASTDDALLFGKMWVNSYEARPDETPTYRPADYTWTTPPQRYNMPFEGGDGFRLDADGKGAYIAPGIGTGPTTHPLTWQRDEAGKSVFRLHVTDDSRPDMRLEIVSVTTDRLTARYLP
ncbi:hypothetical protein [Hymenobacter psychrophilus]|uniref:Lipocalin-like domain-containing protein n=1 Tax=Hymenobacter psychrophilus TaxID=651662 RepID=A0A1H3FIQ4_9BACT|nr:hypothetical protein [Hymenobacter psychrophilus]SDX90014.1 hypothetical protein SAMN04488069_10462 [Hymenobacter psychrophilus]